VAINKTILITGAMGQLPKNIDPQVRDPRRMFTRARICSAAKDLFFEHGVAAVTADQIAKAADIRRSTFYTHFRDKAEILDAIAEDYTVAVKEIIAKLPGPVPTRAEIDAWLQAMVAFTLQERIPTELLMFMTHLVAEPPEAVRKMGAELLGTFSLRIPAFEKALEPGPEHGFKLARALLVMREIGWAICFGARNDGSDDAQYVLAATAELMGRFVNGDY
jgi:AcrR family transcriptional regulator